MNGIVMEGVTEYVHGHELVLGVNTDDKLVVTVQAFGGDYAEIDFNQLRTWCRQFDFSRE